MVTQTRRAPRVVREHTNMAAASAAILTRLKEEARAERRAKLSRVLAAIEPWYDWGTVETFSLKLLSDKSAGRFGDESMGEVRFFTFQWLGLHLHFEIGRTPKTVRS
ncbi:hypothetical protein H5J25_13760 [Sphingomonas aliaeris]|uniref:Uncharacterized protein n=1 Tax=Sphingomonas aliaeris TaxID=2759526 RepID=A0A974S3K4_9SPHN|nr:hypothetical protein [Sphingomonas aliaeris]QQV76511.1 hypothetical protein H5J25_13760 [Sphingomonas aliaeris]